MHYPETPETASKYALSALKRMKEEGIVPKKLVMFTDGYPWDSWGDESYCDALFIVHGGGYGGRSPEAPFGITVPYTREQSGLQG